jgi:rod shape-determining protein MreC
MRNTERRSWSIGDIGIRLLLLSLTALMIMALQQTGQLKAVQSFVTQLTSPAQVSATGATENVTDLFSFLIELRTMRQRNSELEQINSSLVVENFQLREVEGENQQLREMLNFAQTRPGLELRGAQIVARVIGQESNNFLDFIMLDLGSTHGIDVGMPVLTDQGLVGRISEVTNTTSKVLLITDASSSVNALLQSSRLNGVLRGTPGANLVMDYIPQGGLFSVGEVVLTSGLGGNFPKGIPVGQVIEIAQRDIDVFQQAVVRPTVDFGSLELVMVVTNFDPLETVPDLLPDQEPVDEVPAGETEPAGAISVGEAGNDGETIESAEGSASNDLASE